MAQYYSVLCKRKDDVWLNKENDSCTIAKGDKMWQSNVCLPEAHLSLNLLHKKKGNISLCEVAIGRENIKVLWLDLPSVILNSTSKVVTLIQINYCYFQTMFFLMNRPRPLLFHVGMAVFQGYYLFAEIIKLTKSIRFYLLLSQLAGSLTFQKTFET